MSPLSQYQYNNFQELTVEGFDKLRNQSIAEYQQITASAISKVRNFIKEEEEEINQEKDELTKLIKEKDENLKKEKSDKNKEIDKSIKKIIVYTISSYLVNNYLNTSVNHCFIQDSEEETEYNPFNKEEVFEIVLEEETVNLSKDEDDIVLALNLYVPITDSRILSDLVDYNDENNEKKPYFLLPSVVDLSYWFSPVKDQGSLNSCTAFAAVSLLEYFANKNSKDKIEPSAMFLYKAARNKMNATGDVGASIRETMKVLSLFGVPPEQHCPYDEDKVDEDISAYCYAFAQNYKILKYFLLDYAGISKEALVFQIKTVLAAS
ncbi:MAG: C1 family peptidase, partial [Cyanobacteria bacterium J06636_27]